MIKANQLNHGKFFKIIIYIKNIPWLKKFRNCYRSGWSHHVETFWHKSRSMLAPWRIDSNWLRFDKWARFSAGPHFLSSFIYNSCTKIHVVLSFDFLKLAVETPLFLFHNHVTWLALFKRNSEGAPFLENSPQTDGMGRILRKRRKWWEPFVFGGRNEYSTCEVTAELSSKGIPLEFRFWLTPQGEDMRRILHFRRIKGVLRLRRTRGMRSRFSCWVKLFLLKILINVLPEVLFLGFSFKVINRRTARRTLRG